SLSGGSLCGEERIQGDRTSPHVMKCPRGFCRKCGSNEEAAAGSRGRAAGAGPPRGVVRRASFRGEAVEQAVAAGGDEGVLAAAARIMGGVPVGEIVVADPRPGVVAAARPVV